MSLGSRLGNADTRRRRHVRVAVLVAALLAIAAVLVFLVDDDDGEVSEEFVTAANAECVAFSERVASEYELSFPEGPPNDEATAEYLSHAFADTMDELVVALRALPGSDDASDAIDALDARIQEVRADPLPFARRERFVGEGVSEPFDEAGLTACGSDFLPS